MTVTAPTSPAKTPRTWRRLVVRWLCLLLVAYVGVVLMLLLLENWLIFRPARAADWVEKPHAQVQDVVLARADTTLLHGWWFPRPSSTGALLFLPGNAGNLSWRGDALTVLSQRLDCSVLIVDYPGYGKSEGRPSEAGCYEAADAGYDWLRNTCRISADNILLFGESLGGGVAVNLASRKPHRALILNKTFTSMPDVGQALYPYLPIRWLMRNRFDSMALLDLCKRPTFIAHGDPDNLIPFSHGEQLFRASHSPKQLLRMPGIDHNDPLPAEFYDELKSFLAKSAPHLAGTSN
jgi:fermentation-respiration switch protein FrsA (DUF1100 family)